MSRFYLDDSNSSRNSDSDNDSDLPYPAPLQRNDFLSPNFSASTYLSTLSNRHQTLEDLRSELRSRSQLLSKELLDLVNSNYQDFLGLGRDLKSGDEKVEEVKVGLLGFRKEVENVRTKVIEREETVSTLVDERRDIRMQISVGRALVEYESRLARLEAQLMMETTGKPVDDDLSESEDDSDEDNEGSYSMPITKLRKNVQQYRLIEETAKGVGEQHPFIQAQAHRMTKVRNTLLLDLSTALRQAKVAGASGADRIMKVMKVYADMDESVEAVKVLKELKRAR